MSGTNIVFGGVKALTVDEPPEKVAAEFAKVRPTDPVEFTGEHGKKVFVNWANVLYIEPAGDGAGVGGI